MKKRILSLLLGVALVATSAGVPVHATEPEVTEPETTDVVIAEAFPDEYFADYVGANFDTNQDGKLSQEEIADAKIVDLSWEWYLTDTTGIEYLTEATEINLNYLEVDSVDLSKNTKLEVLDIGQTYIENLDLSNNPELKVLKAQRSELTALDVSNNTKLETLNIENTRINSLNVTKNTELKELVLDMSGVSTIDVSKNSKLEKLSLIGCSGITSISFPRTSALKELNISGTGLKSVSLSRCTALESFKNYVIAKVYKHNFETGYGSYVAVEPAPLTSLDLSKNKALKLLYLDGLKTANLTAFDLTAYPTLTKVSFIDTGLKSIKFNDAVTYEAIYLDKNALKEADRPTLADNAKVEWGVQNVTAYDETEGAIDTFDLGSLVDITRAAVVVSDDIEYNAETGIVTFKGDKKEFKYNYSLEETGSYKMEVNVTVEKAPGINIAKAFPDAAFKKHVDKNYDTNKDGFLSPEEIEAVKTVNLTSSYTIKDTTGLEHFTEATEINVNYLDLLSSIDVSKNTKLEKLDIGLTLIEEIDLSNNPELKEFKAQRASLKSLDLSNNPKVGLVHLENNQLDSINLTGCTEVYKLILDMSPLTELNISDCAKLEELTVIGCDGLTSLDTSNNTALKKLDITGTKISEIDLTKNVDLEKLNSYYRAQVLKKKHGTGNVNSGSYVAVDPAPLKTLDVTKNEKLNSLILDGSDLENFKDVDLAALPASLEYVSFENMGITSLKFNDEVTYTKFYLTGNHLKELDAPAKIAESATTLDWGTHTVTAAVPFEDTLETFDLSTFVDIARVEVVTSDDVAYDAETGIVTFNGDKKEFSYKYSIDEAGKYKMTVNVTVEKEAYEGAVELKKDTYVYNGKDAEPAVVTLTDGKGNVIPKEYYDVTYDENSAEVGKHNVTISLKGKYSGEIKAEYVVVPAEVEGLKVFRYQVGNRVKLEWKESEGATGYKVQYKSAKSSKTYTKYVKTLSDVKNGLACSKTYTFKVTPYFEDENGVKYMASSEMDSVKLTTAKSISKTVGQVTETSVEKSSSKKVKVKWDNVKNEKGYQISRSSKADGTNIVKTVRSTSAKSTTVSGGTKGKTYYYKVRAYRTVGTKRVYSDWTEAVAYTLE